MIVEGNKQLQKYAKLPKESLPFLKAVVVWGEPIDPQVASTCTFATHTWETFLELGAAVDSTVITERYNALVPGNCSTLIYTSGTTGPPKAVMISHDNVTWTSTNMSLHYMDLNHTDRVISYLPLSHIAAQVSDIISVG